MKAHFSRWTWEGSSKLAQLISSTIYVLPTSDFQVIAHAPMLDLGGLIKPGSIVRMTESKPGGKTSHAVQLVRQVNNFFVCRIWHEWLHHHISIVYLLTSLQGGGG